MFSQTSKLGVFALAGLFLASPSAMALTLVSPGNGGWTVSVGGVDADPLHPSETFQSKTTADRAAQYLNDLETAAAKNDKVAYDHALSNLKALVEIAQQNYEAGAVNVTTFYVHAQIEADYQMGGETLPGETWEDREKRKSKIIQETMDADPQGKLAYTNNYRALIDYLAVQNLASIYGNRIWAVGEEVRFEAAHPLKPSGQPSATNPGGGGSNSDNPHSAPTTVSYPTHRTTGCKSCSEALFKLNDASDKLAEDLANANASPELIAGDRQAVKDLADALDDCEKHCNDSNKNGGVSIGIGIGIGVGDGHPDKEQSGSQGHTTPTGSSH